jgi:hypothetical protein
VAASYTTADLLTSVLNRAQLPSSTNDNNVNSNTNLLVLATEEIYTKLLPLIMSVREEWYVATYNHTITANQSHYVFPPRASGRVLRDVQLVDGTELKLLGPIDPEDITTTATGTPEYYYVEDDHVVLYPTPAMTSGTLRLRYFRRPNRLVATSSCAQISSVNTNTNVVTLTAAPPSSWGVGTLIDFVRHTSPFTTLGMDYAITAISGSDVTFASLPALHSAPTQHNWLAPAEYTPIPQIPQEFFPVLAQMTVVKALEAYGDRAGAGAAKEDLKDITKNALELISPRLQGERKKVISKSW